MTWGGVVSSPVSREGLPALPGAPLRASEGPRARPAFRGAPVSPVTEPPLHGACQPSRGVAFPGVRLTLSCAVALLAERSAVSVARGHTHTHTHTHAKMFPSPRASAKCLRSLQGPAPKFAFWLDFWSHWK